MPYVCHDRKPVGLCSFVNFRAIPLTKSALLLLRNYLKTDREPPLIPAQAGIQTPAYLSIPQTVFAPMPFEIVF